MKNAHKIGAVAFALWGVVHILGAAAMLMTLSGDGGSAALAMLADSATDLPGATHPVVDALYAFHSWNLMWIGALVLVIAIRRNWKNDMAGYWYNLAIVAAADAGLLFTLILPGHMSFAAGSPGLVLFAVALVFSSMGYKVACDARDEARAAGLSPATA